MTIYCTQSRCKVFRGLEQLKAWGRLYSGVPGKGGLYGFNPFENVYKLKPKKILRMFLGP